ncbi:MAG: hypothetical protein CBB81_01075 [Cellvibrionales bacterium TMED21]|nr:hypothetical protein [Halieaceae bacterium]OUT67624.1 MAG: hypothetical protein CBB81_01075 [Cellvibrionales bacterium TMED21]
MAGDRACIKSYVTAAKTPDSNRGIVSSGLSRWSFITDCLELIRARWQVYSSDAGTVFENRLPPFGKVRGNAITGLSRIAIEVIEPLA